MAGGPVLPDDGCRLHVSCLASAKPTIGIIKLAVLTHRILQRFHHRQPALVRLQYHILIAMFDIFELLAHLN